jgi:superfamily II DNA or RNA helicase
MYQNYLDVDGYHIKKKYITEEQQKEIMKELTVSPRENLYNEDDKVIYKVYTLTDHEIIVPKYFGIKKFGIPKKVLYNPEKKTFNFKGQLRDNQNNIAKKCYDYIITNGGGLLSVPCGRGKTVMALQICSLIGLKTLVVVHKADLIDQWIARGESFTDAKFGIIRQNKAIVEDKDIVIGTIQSIAKHDYDPDIFKQFGFVIYDEAHHTPAHIFSQALSKTGSNYSLALTATPYRSDGLIKIMHWYVGDTIYRETLQTNNQVVSKVIHYFSDDKLFQEKKSFIKGRFRPNSVKMITNIIHIEQKNKIILDVIKQLCQENRVIILLSERLKHLETLKTQFDTLVNNKYKTYYYIGRLTRDERLEAIENGNVFFATYKMAQEALDIERLNTVIFVTSQKDVIQASGRILRKVLQNGDIRPLIVDFSDQLSIYINQGIKREKYYAKAKYNIEHYYCINNEFVSLQKFQKLVFGNDRVKDVEIYPKINEILYVPPVELIAIEPTTYNDNEEKNEKNTKNIKHHICLFDDE